MKYIKSYENITPNPIQLNNYIILIDDVFNGRYKDKIAQIVRINSVKDSEYYDVKYPSEILSGYLRITSGTTKIKHWSKDKKDLETLLAQNKYNL